MVISTLEGKLERIDNLDKVVEHLMHRIEALDNRLVNNIDKTDFVISKLKVLDNLSFDLPETLSSKNQHIKSTIVNNNLDSRLGSLDQKVTDIDSKLEVLKLQIDNNFLAVDDINAEASEKKPVSMNVIEITKSMNAEVLQHVTKELGHLKQSSDVIDKKLQFHINIVSENLDRMVKQMNDIHEAVVEQHEHMYWNQTRTTTPYPTLSRGSKIDTLVQQIKPIMSVSEKMDEVWDVVIGTKSSVDDLLPKSDELLTHTQRQERAIGEIHSDLRTKTNLIIENLDMVEKRLKKQEDDVAVLAQRPVPPELLMDPTIDRLVEYDSNRYSIVDDTTDPIQTTIIPPTLLPSLTPQNISTSSSFSTLVHPPNVSGKDTITVSNSVTTTIPLITIPKPLSRKGGIIFPSIKNKPSVVNSTFTAEALAFKDVKVSLKTLEPGYNQFLHVIFYP